jgi:gas vesicle protein
LSLSEFKEKLMRRKLLNNHKKSNTGKVVTGILLGGVVGAAVGWLTAPVSGEETRRRLTGARLSAREKIETSAGNIESQAHELMEAIGENPAISRPRTTST